MIGRAVLLEATSMVWGRGNSEQQPEAMQHGLRAMLEVSREHRI